MSAAHAALPWMTDADVDHELVVDASGDLVADCAIFFADGRDVPRAANAAHIVRCVNAHDDLLALVSRAAAAGPMILDKTFATQLVRDCHAALAKVDA